MQTIKMENWFDSQSWNIKMAPKMAASNALKTYLTNKLDKKHLIWTFYGCLEA